MTRLLWLVCLFAASLAMSASAAPEYSIKAGYLLLFTRYVEWPASAFDSAAAPINICILGADPFGSVLDGTIAGQQSQQRSLRARRIEATSEAAGCHVIFIAANASTRTRQWLDELGARPALTVTEDPELLKYGAALCFVSEIDQQQARIRFEANLEWMQRAGLTASSEMLVAARKVHRDSSGL